jgi:hypothetical protein
MRLDRSQVFRDSYIDGERPDDEDYQMDKDNL